MLRFQCLSVPRVEVNEEDFQRIIEGNRKVYTVEVDIWRIHQTRMNYREDEME